MQDRVKLPKKKHKRWPWVLLVLVTALVLMIVVIRGRSEPAGSNLRQAKLEMGSLTVTVIGTGHLDYHESSDLEVPAGLLVDRVYPEAGDRVAQGDPLASFDPLSIQLAIDTVLAEIDTLDLAIARTPSTADSKVIRSLQAGRVKAIYIEKGDQAAQVYKSHGAVILLSLDDRMAVSFGSTAELTQGDKVRVLTSGGVTREGRVDKREGNLYLVTLTDNGPEPGEAVTLQDKEGTEIGTGNLYVHRPLEVVATEGIIKDIHVSENQKITAGKALFTLEDLPAGSDYDKLFADRKERREKLDDLLELQKTGELRAPFDLYILASSLKEGEKTGAAADMEGLPQTGALTYPAFTVAPLGRFALTINIDELDILSVREGQQAAITFDAIENQVFSGTIDHVASTAIESGGIAKYRARILLDSQEQMRVGMSVTAAITVDEKKDILLLPVAALQESGGRVFVYTEKDEKNLELSGETEVETGLSDGDKVEVIQGLAEGVTVFYKVTTADSLFPFSPPNHRMGGNGPDPEGTANE